MALNTYNFASVPTGFDLAPPLDGLIPASGIDVVRSPTQKAYPDAQGFQVRVNGVGLTYDAAGHFTGGVITSIQVVSIDQFNNVTIVEQTAGFAVLAVNYQNAFNVSPLDAIKLVMAGPDTVNGDAQNDLLQGHEGNDTLNGNAGNDRLEGGAGNDTLNGGNGDDTMVGGLGVDNYNGGAGFDEIDSSDSYNNPAAVTGITVVVGANAMLNYQGAVEGFTGVESWTGTQFADTFIGSVGDDTFRGLGGADGFAGNAGIDTVAYDRDAKFGGAAGVTVNLTTNTGTDGFGNTDTYSGIENVIGSDQNDTITGGAGPNVLRGLGGNDTLDGGATGFDILRGGKGDDTYVVDHLGVTVDEAADSGDGIDTVKSSVSFNLATTLGAVENLILTGAAAINGFGNDLDNRIEGNDAVNLLVGGSGNDTMLGNGGNDVMTGDGGSDNMDGGAGDDNMAGGIGNDTMQGGLGDDTISGGDGNDTIDGGAGQNTLNGGLGNDTYVLGDKADGFDSITDTGGNDTVTSSIDRSLAFYSGVIENLKLTGTAHVGTGNAGDNIITGNDAGDTLSGLDGNDTLIGGLGNDTLIGGNGADNMQGGLGNDTYFADGSDNISDTGGNDTVFSFETMDLDRFVGIENFTMQGVGNISGFGNALNNVIRGNAGNNHIVGEGGNDTLIGGLGNDRIEGGLGADNLQGGSGNDTLDGDAGRDTINTGLGRDHVVIDSRSALSRDVITDFSHAFDTFDLVGRVFSALGPTVTNNEFRLGTHALDRDDHLIYDRSHGNLFYDTNGSAAGGSTLIAVLSNHQAINASDFHIV